jgi:hypothetical protein
MATYDGRIFDKKNFQTKYDKQEGRKYDRNLAKIWL